MLCIKAGLKRQRAFEHLLAGIEVRATDRRLPGEVDLTGLEGSRVRLLESFRLGRGPAK